MIPMPIRSVRSIFLFGLMLMAGAEAAHAQSRELVKRDALELKGPVREMTTRSTKPGREGITRYRFAPNGELQKYFEEHWDVDTGGTSPLRKWTTIGTARYDTAGRPLERFAYRPDGDTLFWQRLRYDAKGRIVQTETVSRLDPEHLRHAIQRLNLIQQFDSLDRVTRVLNARDSSLFDTRIYSPLPDSAGTMSGWTVCTWQMIGRDKEEGWTLVSTTDSSGVVRRQKGAFKSGYTFESTVDSLGHLLTWFNSRYDNGGYENNGFELITATYDDHGFLVRRTEHLFDSRAQYDRGEKGKLKWTETSTYELDAHGNWVKRTVVKQYAGLSTKTIEREERTILYYEN